MRTPFPHVHLAGLPFRARADRWPLLATVLLLAVVSALAGSLPGLLRTSADASVQAAVADAGSSADLTVTIPLTQDRGGGAVLAVDAAGDLQRTASTVAHRVESEAPGAFLAPVATVTTGRLDTTLARGEQGLSSLHLAYLWREGGPAVRWLAGGPGRNTVPAGGGPDDGGVPWPVEVGLSTDVAAALGVGVGDLVPARDRDLATDVPVRVSGVFTVDDPDDPQWAVAPGLLTPAVAGSGPTASTQLVGLLSPGSLPVARLLGTSTAARTVVLAPRPTAVTSTSADALARAVARLEAAPTTFTAGEDASVRSGLDTVLLAAADRARTAQGQASVLLSALVLVGTAGVLVSAQVLVQRRFPVLAAHRARGASLPGVAVELALESVVVTATGTAVGVAVGTLVAGAGPRWWWVLPGVLVGVLAPPVVAVVRTAALLRPPSPRRARDRSWRRGALEGVALVAALVSVLAARRTAPEPPTGLLPGACLALVCLVAALVVVRICTPVPGRVLALARRSRGLLPTVAAARAAATVTATAPALLVLVLAATVASAAATLGATVERGREAGSWQAVGADASIHLDTGVEPVRRELTDRPGVDAVVTGRVEDTAQVIDTRGATGVRLVVADPTGLDRLRRAGGLSGVPALPQDTPTAGADAVVPALVSADLAGPAGGAVQLRWSGSPVVLRVVGRTPALGEGARPTVVVAPQALSAVSGTPVLADTAWVLGPGAATAVDGVSHPGADVVLRTSWIEQGRTAPLTRGLDELVAAATGTALLTGVLVVLLLASSGAAGRSHALSALRTTGLSTGRTRTLTLLEVVVPGLVAAVTGTGLGIAAALVVSEPLALQLLTGQAAAPRTTTSWWCAAAVPLFLLTGAVTASVESAVRERRGLGPPLRLGPTA